MTTPIYQREMKWDVILYLLRDKIECMKMGCLFYFLDKVLTEIELCGVWSTS